MITQERLKELLHYNADTGNFDWHRRYRGCRLDRIGHLTRFGYLLIGIDGRSYQAHRLAWLYIHGEMPKHQIDHINGDKLDNRIENLRDVSQHHNCKNKSRAKNNTSGVTGVYWSKTKNKWKASIGINNKTKALGSFDTIFDAAAARISAQNKLGYHKNHGKR